MAEPTYTQIAMSKLPDSWQASLREMVLSSQNTVGPVKVPTGFGELTQETSAESIDRRLRTAVLSWSQQAESARSQAETAAATDLDLAASQEAEADLWEESAEDLQAVLADWRTFGPQQPSAFLQHRALVDSLIQHGVALNVTLAWVKITRDLLGGTAPFPKRPPLGSRAQMDNFSPEEMARFLAVSVLQAYQDGHPLPTSQQVMNQQGLALDTPDMTKWLMGATAAEMAAVSLVTVAGVIEKAGLSSLLGYLEQAQKAAEGIIARQALTEDSPAWAPFAFILATCKRYSDAIKLMETPVDALLDAPRQAKGASYGLEKKAREAAGAAKDAAEAAVDEIEKAKEELEQRGRDIGTAAAVGVAAVFATLAVIFSRRAD